MYSMHIEELRCSKEVELTLRHVPWHQYNVPSKAVAWAPKSNDTVRTVFWGKEYAWLKQASPCWDHLMGLWPLMGIARKVLLFFFPSAQPCWGLKSRNNSEGSTTDARADLEQGRTWVFNFSRQQEGVRRTLGKWINRKIAEPLDRCRALIYLNHPQEFLILHSTNRVMISQWYKAGCSHL